MASPTVNHAGVKRPNDASDQPNDVAAKKRRVHHALTIIQEKPSHIEPAPQDPIFAQAQLLRSIGAALVFAGFDSVKPSALEMFRSHAEEYMLKFLTHARQSMHDSRRTKPTALDFVSSLAHMPNAASASQLMSQLNLAVPKEVACPSISEPALPPPPAPDFSKLLEPLMTQQPPSYIPRHFPPLPPRHAWQQTDVFPERESDARKMREKATEEGTMAEQALRKLAAAAKAGAMKVERRRHEQAVEEFSRKGNSAAANRHRVREKQDTFGDVLKDLGDSDEVVELGLDGTADAVEGSVDLGMPEGVIVNHDMAHWRRGRHRQSLHGFM